MNQLYWQFCNPQANVPANCVGGTSLVHQCISQPNWWFCNPRSGGGTSVYDPTMLVFL